MLGHRVPLVTSASLLFVLGGCGESPVPTEVTPPETPVPAAPAAPAVDEYLTALPTWDVFSPTLEPVGPIATADPEALPPETGDVTTFGEDGAENVIPNVTFACEVTPYTLTRNPEEIVMYSPDLELMWPGALIQGKSYRSRVGSLLGLPIAERTPIRVSIPGLATDDNFREVASPDQASVAQAIGGMVGAATAGEVVAPSSITFEQRTVHSLEQWALEGDLSFDLLGFGVSVSGGRESETATTTIAVHFQEKMFEAVVAPPQTPGHFFSSAFTQDVLDEQVALGRLGPENIPVYISNVVYGRMMMFTLTSTATETELRKAINAAKENLFCQVTGIGCGPSGSLSEQNRKILQTADVSINSLGGDASATIAMIRSGNWASYFDASAPLSSAAPLSYTFRNLSDGSIAKVSESTDYEIKTCVATAAAPGGFTLLAGLDAAPGISTPMRSHLGDMNGDGRIDLVFNHLSAAGNEVVIGLGQEDGTFSFGSPITSPDGGWNEFEARIGDVDGDGDDDLAWATPRGRLSIGLSDGAGGVTFSGGPNVNGAFGPGTDMLLADFSGDGRAEMLWNSRFRADADECLGRDAGGTCNWLAGTIATDAGQVTVNDGQPFSYVPPTRPTSWFTFDVLTGDFNGDGKTDLVWDRIFGNEQFVARGALDGSTDTSPFLANEGQRQNLSDPTTRKKALVGDFDGDGRDDILWNERTRPDADGQSSNTTYPAFADGNGVFDERSLGPSHTGSDEDWSEFTIHSGDVNGDGLQDLVWNRLDGALNRVYASMGTRGRSFADQAVLNHFEQGVDWRLYELLIGDVNGDGVEDLVWVLPSGRTRIFVALGTP